jgi:hypothetical protein
MKLRDIKRSTVSCVIMIVIFVAFIATFSIGTLVTDDRTFSEMENRNLTQKPEVTSETVFSGELDDDFESYLSDQIFKKDSMMTLKTSFDYFSGKTFQNGVFFGKDGYLLQQFTEDSEQISENVSYLNAFADSIDVPVDFILAPNSICLNSDKLPLGAYTDDQRKTTESVSEQLSENITLFDPYDTLYDLQNNQGVQAYYKTDHHWTASAARAVCDSWLESAGYEGTDGDYVYNTVDDFYGTLYSKAPASFVAADTFGYYENTSGSYTVRYVKENTFSYSMMNTEYLKKKDKYSSFFGGNYSQIKITSDSKNKEKILVIKDSYANSLIPFLADKFSEVYVIDLRYFHFDSASELIAENNINRVLMVYNIDFLNEDKNFIWLE